MGPFEAADFEPKDDAQAMGERMLALLGDPTWSNVFRIGGRRLGQEALRGRLGAARRFAQTDALEDEVLFDGVLEQASAVDQGIALAAQHWVICHSALSQALNSCEAFDSLEQCRALTVIEFSGWCW